MGDEGDDPEILQLQSESVRRSELLTRIKLKKDVISAELDRRSEDLARIKQAIDQQKLLSSKPQENSNLKEDQAVSMFMEEKVRLLLGDRIPTLKPQTGSLGEGERDTQDDKDGKQDDSRHHDTVLVRYVEPTQDRPQVYCVLYRIGNDTSHDTTIEMLHRDACAYWGCSHKDYELAMFMDADGRIDEDKVTEKQKKRLSVDNPKNAVVDFLNPKHDAILYLIRSQDLDDNKVIDGILAKEKEEKQNSQKEEPDKSSEGAVDTTTEMFVEALQHWPGMYWLLKKRKKKRHNTYKEVKMRDIVIYVLLIIITALCINLREVNDAYIMVGAAEDYLVSGVAGHTSQPWRSVQDFSKIQVYDNIWWWLQGGFHYQVFNASSPLRKHFVPVGFMRLRQQRVKKKSACYRDYPAYLRRDCYYVHVGVETQETQRLIFPSEWEIYRNQSLPGSGRLASPQAEEWVTSSKDTAPLVGLIQRFYDGTGYSVEYSLAPENITDTANIFFLDLPFFQNMWIAKPTRVFSLEFTLANHNVGAYLFCIFMFEFSPSGAIASSHYLQPFRISKSGSTAVADGLEYPRAFFILGYILFFRTYFELKSTWDKGHHSVHYLFSFFGLVDIATIIVNLLIITGRLLKRPPLPKDLTAFYSYSTAAHDSESLQNTEAVLLLLLLIRLASFMIIIQSAFQIWKTFSRSISVLTHYCFVFFPVLVGTMFLASSIWSSAILGFSTPLETIVTVLVALKNALGVKELAEHSHSWTLLFTIYFFSVASAFFMNMFVAIAVHAYWQVQILYGRHPLLDAFDRDEALDWMLWGPLYNGLTGQTPSSAISQDRDGRGGADSGDDDEEEEYEETGTDKKTQ